MRSSTSPHHRCLKVSRVCGRGGAILVSRRSGCLWRRMLLTSTTLGFLILQSLPTDCDVMPKGLRAASTASSHMGCTLHCVAWRGLAWPDLALRGVALPCVAVRCRALPCVAVRCRLLTNGEALIEFVPSLCSHLPYKPNPGRRNAEEFSDTYRVIVGKEPETLMLHLVVR